MSDGTTIRIAKRFNGHGAAPNGFAPPVRIITSSWMWRGILAEADRRNASEKTIIREALVEYLERRGIRSPAERRPAIIVSPPTSNGKLARACGAFIRKLREN